MVCKNCSKNATDHFCSHCGQKTSVTTLSFTDILHEGWHNLTHTDKGYFKLFWDMAAKPGITINNYLKGQRKRYFSPFTFYIVTTSLLILSTHWVFKYEDAKFHINNEFGNYVAQNLNYILLCSIPVITILFWLMFKRYFSNLAEAFTLMMFTYGALNFYLIICNLFFFIFIRLHYVYMGYANLIGYFFVFYIIYSFLRPLSFWNVLKLLLMVFFFYIIVQLIGPAISLIIYGVPIKILINSFSII